MKMPDNMWREGCENLCVTLVHYAHSIQHEGTLFTAFFKHEGNLFF